MPQLLARTPECIDTYYEPFVGGGALFFALTSLPATDARLPRRAVLNDRNADLITTYEVVRDRLDTLLERLTELQHDYVTSVTEDREALYYRVRAERPERPRAASAAIEVAARLLFLNKTCFNGLYRVNRKGGFNVPHGRYANPTICDEPALRAASRALQHVELRSEDFEEACDGAGPGDFVYFDPPFQPLSPTSSFTAYTRDSFGWPDQLRLKTLIDRLTRRGVAVMLSDAAHEDLESLYLGGGYALDGYSLAAVDARRAINSRGDRRGPIGELIVTNYDPALPAAEDTAPASAQPELALQAS